MKLINGEIYDARKPLGRLMAKELPVDISLKLVQLAQKLDAPNKAIEDVRSRLIRKHGGEEKIRGRCSGRFQVIPPGDPKGRKVSKGFLKYEKDFTELMNIEVEVNFKKVTIPSKIDGQPLKISAVDLILLKKFVEVK